MAEAPKLKGRYRRPSECAGFNVSERWAILEKDDAQADLTTLSGKADTAGESSEEHPSCCAWVVAIACTQGKHAQHGKPLCVAGDGQPDAREGQAGRIGVAERPVVPGNAGGGKGPQFKINAISGKGQEIGQPINSVKGSETTDGVTRKSEG